MSQNTKEFLCKSVPAKWLCHFAHQNRARHASCSLLHGRPSGAILMVTGAYYPELSGGGLQCREIIHNLGNHLCFTVLTTTIPPVRAQNAPTHSTGNHRPFMGLINWNGTSREEVDGIPVYRIPVDVLRKRSKLWAVLRLAIWFIRHQHRFDLIHLHGVSQKNIPLTLLARLFRKRIILTLHTAKHDEPPSVRSRGELAYWCYTQAHRFAGVSERIEKGYLASSLPAVKFTLIPNGVNLNRFHPAEPGEKERLRKTLGLPTDAIIILFVGYFSQDKCPHLLFRAWKDIKTHPHSPWLLYIGATRSRYYEVDSRIAEQIRLDAREVGIEHRLIFVEVARRIEQYYRAADMFVLPSRREGLPVALLEAMASGLPCVASNLSGSTDTIIDHGINGLLIPPEDVSMLKEALEWALSKPDRAQALAEQARRTIQERFSNTQTAIQYLKIYRELLPPQARPLS